MGKQCMTYDDDQRSATNIFFTGHTATIWQGDKLLVFGGENEHRMYLSDVIIFDLKTSTWTQPELSGLAPQGRARHAAVIHDEKLFILGGMQANDVLDDICYLDLKTWTWSRTWKFVSRFDHSVSFWNGRLWVFGGMSEDMERTSEIWWLDLQGNPLFQAPPTMGSLDRWASRGQRTTPTPQLTTGQTGYAANSSSIQMTTGQISRSNPTAPGSISSVRFVSSPNLPAQNVGTHFHVFSSGCLLDFATPTSALAPLESSLSALDLDTLRWQKLVDGKDLFNPTYRWHYCTVNEDGTQAWLLGCPAEAPRDAADQGEYLSHVLPIDLRKLGLLGNKLALESHYERSHVPASDANAGSFLTGIGADLARTFDRAPEEGSGADFIITAEPEEFYSPIDEEDRGRANSAVGSALPVSKAIHVHSLILCTRWPHFARLYASQMLEYQTKKLHIPEPYSAVRAFLYYLYTDNINASPSSASDPSSSPTLSDVAGMLVMANIYGMPRLRLLCVNRLGRELDIEHAATIWERAGTANEEWLRRRAASFCMMHWGRVVRTVGFKCLPRRSLLDLCEEIDVEGRVVGGDELEAVGGLGGSKFGGGGLGIAVGKSRRQPTIGPGEEDGIEEEPEDEGMDVN